MASVSTKSAGLLGALAAAGAVVTALVVGGRPPPPAPPPPPEEVQPSTPLTLEESDIEGDFELVDPDVIPTAGLEGVVTTLSDLPLPLTQRTLRYVNHFGASEKGRKTFAERYRKASRFREHLEQKLHDLDFPEDVMWLAAIESGFNPQATSPAGAAGLFQFMPETAERFGLSVSSVMDERRSITKSADAAFAYLGFLYDTYQSWDLALAAYNCGEGRLADALAKARAALGRAEEDPVAFHELAELRLLPRETMNFVPQIHAFAIVVHNRELLGLDDIEPLPLMRFAEIAVPAGTRLAPIARAADISIATLREYNPDLLTDRLPAGQGDFLVNIPADSLEQTLAALPALVARDGAHTSPPDREPARVASVSNAEIAAVAPNAQKRAPSAPDGKAAPPVASAEVRPKVTLLPAPLRPGTFMTESGVFIELERAESADVEITARVDLLDPTKARVPLGQTFRLEPRTVKLPDLDKGLSSLSRDLSKLLREDAAPKLRVHLAGRRDKFYDRTGFEDMFRDLSDRAFAKGHPMKGALLVGPTEPADDMFLEPEPTWALDTTVRIRGAVDLEERAESIQATFADPFAPARLPALAPSAHAVVGDGDRHLLVGWVAPPVAKKKEAAFHLAFMIACHNKVGRLHRALRHETSIAARANCSLELAPQAAVGWVLASPAAPHTVAEAEKAVDDAISRLLKDGPSDAEVSVARERLRVELAREKELATIRGLPKSLVSARNTRLLEDMKHVSRTEVVSALRVLFSSEHKIVVAGG